MVALANPDVQATSTSATTTHAPHHVSSTTAVAANIDATSSTTKYAHYIHQIICSPPASTLLGVLDLSEELATIPSLTTTLIKNHLPHSTATYKGHMQQHQANTASTRNMQSDIIDARAKVDCIFPPQETCAMQDMFCLLRSPIPIQAPCMLEEFNQAVPDVQICPCQTLVWIGPVQPNPC
jgi:hypothetical protein